MLHARLLHMALVGFAVCSFLSGCRGEHGGADKDPFLANFDRIKNDGSQDLAAVETIMGAKGTEDPKEDWNKHGGIDPKAPPFTKSKLVKENDNTFKAVTDKNGTEAKVYRWVHESKHARTYIYVAVLEDKVVFKGRTELTNITTDVPADRPNEVPK